MRGRENGGVAPPKKREICEICEIRDFSAHPNFWDFRFSVFCFNIKFSF